ncbi:hypothetical protein F5146DRAFT_1122701 [Armillaria mellea]|nr:hypothetical protein F5146DRAFT_1122701 [Armillaria mellea]
MTDTSVLIAGAGPSGLSLAVALRQNGTIGQKGCGIQPRILELYKFMGVLPDVLKKGGPVVPFIHHLPNGETKTINTATKSEPIPDKPYNDPILLGQDRHEAVLREHLAKPVEETIESRWLIGSEGARSVVRTALGLTFLGETRQNENMVVGDIRIIKPQLDEDPADNKYQFFITGYKLDTTEAASGRDAFIKEFYAISGRTDIEFGELVVDIQLQGSISSQRMPNIRMVDKYGSGRAFVAGDAAHVHSPSGGQGLNSGIQDSLLPLLDTYSQERIPVIAAMLDKTTDLHNKTFTAGAASSEGWRRGPELYQFGVNYPSIRIGRERDGPVRAGDRAPDAPGLVSSQGEKTSLFEIFLTSYHTVLIFPGSDLEVKPILDLLKAYPAGTVKSVVILNQDDAPTVDVVPADFVLGDGEGYGRKHYNDRNGIVIVRPDGMVGALVGGVDGLKRYFNGIFL